MPVVRKSCDGHQQILGSRLRQGHMLLDLGRTLVTDEAVRADIVSMKTSLTIAGTKCAQDLEKPPPSTTQGGLAAQAFGELGMEALAKIRQIVGPSVTICTQLSNIFGSEEASDLIPEGGQARATISSALSSMEGDKNNKLPGIAMWAPAAADAGRMVASFAQGSVLADKPWSLHLIYPVDPMFHGLNLEELKDVWRCPALKWSQLLYNVVLLDTPDRIVPPGKGPPVSQWKALCICSLSGEGGSAGIPPSLKLPEGEAHRGGTNIWLDIPVRLIAKVRREIIGIMGGTPFVFTPQERSPSHDALAPRVKFSVAIKEGAVNQFDLVGIITILKQRCKSSEILAALGDILRDPHALIAELSHQEAVMAHTSLIREAIFVDNKTALIRTDSLPDAWKRR